jgi:hypothetical protein
MRKKIIEEKVEEWEVKSHVCWPSLTPQLSLFPPSLSLARGLFGQERKASFGDDFPV